MLSNMTSIATALLFTLAAALGSVATQAQDRQPIGVGDLVRFTAIGDPLALDWRGGNVEYRAAKGEQPGLFSPDGSHVAVTLRGGDPDRETNTATLLVYPVAELMHDPQPIKLAEFASATSFQPIAFVRWLSGNETLVFAGTRGEEVSQIFRVNIRTRALEQLTHAGEQFVWYDVAPTGNRLVTLSESARLRPADDSECKRHGCRVATQSLYDAEHGGVSRIVSGTLHDLSTGKSRPLIDPESADAKLNFCDPEFTGGISPDGRFAIRLCRFHDRPLPAWWGEYTMNPELRECAAVRNPRCWRYGYIVDLDSGKPDSWTDAPQAPVFWTAPPLWIDGGRHVIIPAGFESLTGVGKAERAIRASAYAVQLLDPALGKTSRIGRLDPKMAHATGASWNEKTQILTVRGEDAQRMALHPAYFRRNGTQWTTIQAPPSTATGGMGIKLTVEQSLNDPPVLVSIDEKTGLKKKILDPNPWLAMRKLGRVEAIRWPAGNDRTWSGGLYYPPEYKTGQRYPLVLQTHGFEPGQFSLQGGARNFPGQALAAHGIMVLQIAENDRDVYYTPQYWAANRTGYEGAIDYLDRLGLIDRNRVGAVGWSATGPTTSYLLTHSDYPIAAAAFTDTGVYGWWYYLMSGGSQQKETKFGTQPFGEGIAPWLEQSPTFNLVRVRTPLLMWGAGGVTGTWDWHAGLKSLGKPVEFWNLPTGTHDIYQASQRLKMNQLLVDWFQFWLKDEERTEIVAFGKETAVSLQEQYTRWREFRKQQQRILEQPRSPLLQWTAKPAEQP